MSNFALTLYKGGGIITKLTREATDIQNELKRKKKVLDKRK